MRSMTPPLLCSMTTLSDLAVEILGCADGSEKARLSHAAVEKWRSSNGTMTVGSAIPPLRPARPARPQLLPPNEMPRRRGQSAEARAALLHAVLHIELNAIDLAWDMVARFGDEALPRDFFDDWVRVADEEAKHFEMLSKRLADLGFRYGDFPAHDGLWEAAQSTAEDFAARLAVVPMVLEARGLDVTPGMIKRFAKMGDQDSVNVLNVILKEEIGHVAIGNRWFQHYCKSNGLNAREHWQHMVGKFFKGLLKPPFNEEAREQAGVPPDYYLPLSSGALKK